MCLGPTFDCSHDDDDVDAMPCFFSLSRSRSAHLERRVPQPPGPGPPRCIHPETPGYLLTPPSSPAGRFVSAAKRHHLFASLSQGSCVARPISALFTRQGSPIEAWKSLSGAFCGNYGWAKEAWLCLVRSLRDRIPARMRVGRRVGQWGPWRSWGCHSTPFLW